MNDILIKIDTKTAKAYCENNRIGVQHANLQNKLIFEMTEKIVGSAWLEYEINGTKNYAEMEDTENGYQIDIKSCLLISNNVNVDLKITESENADGIPIFVSTIVDLDVYESINATTEEPEYYPDWKTVADSKIAEMDQLKTDVNTAIDEVNNLDIDISKSGKIATVELTKKDATTKTVTLNDGTSLMFNWDGTKLGIKTDEDSEYTYVDLQGVQGPIGPQGEAFQIKKTYSSVAAMNADFNNMNLGDYVMIASEVSQTDNAKLYTRGESQWIFISDFSGAQGIRGETGLTPNIQIGTVTSGTTPSVTRTGTNENPILNFVLEKGEQGTQGIQGATGNGITSITKTGTEDNVDTYTILYTNGTSSTFTVTNGEVSQSQLNAVQSQLNKYKTLSKLFPKIEGEGTNVTLNDTVEGVTLDTTLEGNTSQYSTTGKNKMPLVSSGTITSYTTTDTKTQTITIENGIIHDYAHTTEEATGEFTRAYKLTGALTVANYANYLPTTDLFLLPAGTYSLNYIYLSGTYSNTNSGNNNRNMQLFKVVDGTRTRIGYMDNLQNQNKSITFTLEEETELYISYGEYVSSGLVTTVNMDTYFKVSITEGETPDYDWELYTGGNPSPSPLYPQPIKVVTGNQNIQIGDTNYPLSLGDLELNGTGGYKDFIYGSPNNWNKGEIIRKIVLDGTNNALTSKHTTISSETKGFYGKSLSNKHTGSNESGATDLGFSDNFKFLSGGAQACFNNNSNGLWWEGTTSNIYMILEETTLTAANNWLQTHPTTIYYVMKEVISTQIVDSTLITQLNNLYNAVADNDTTSIVCTSSSSDNETMIVKASTYKDISSILNPIESVGD